MKIYPILFFLFFIGNCIGQDFNTYTPLKCAGKLPSDFTQRTSTKVSDDISNEINRKEKESVKDSKSEFLLKSNYMVDELLMGGNILFGDTVTNYLNKVADKVLENDKGLRSQLRFYCLKSNMVNAFTTNQGMIFVTLGLISQLDNEAQLAYILAHEITHYKKKHVINAYIESDKIFSNKDRYKTKNYDENILRLSKYSKSLEFEADSIGFDIMINTEYDLKEALTVFDVLQYARLPFDEVAFDYSFIESPAFKIPTEYKLDTIIPISELVDTDDSRSSHPNVVKRRNKVIEYISAAKSNGKTYLVSEDEFKHVRNVCRFEGVRIDLTNMNYVRAMYDAFVLQKTYPNSTFLKHSICKSLYSIGKYKNASEYNSIVESYNEYEGEISQAYYCFEKMTGEQILSLAMRYLNTLEQNDFLSSVLNDIVQDLYYTNDLPFEKFAPEVPTNFVMILPIDTIATDTTSGDDIDVSFTDEKYKSFHLQAFEDTKDKVKIKKAYDELINSTAQSNASEIEADLIWNQLSYQEKKKHNKKRTKRELKDKYKIGAKKIVYVDPEYFVVDERKGVKLINSENHNYSFYKSIQQQGKTAELDVEVLSVKLFKEDDVELYNDISSFNTWSREKRNHIHFLEETNIIGTENEYITSLSNKYNTSLFAYSGVLVFKAKKHDVAYGILLGLFAVQIYLPYAIYYAVTPDYYTFHYTLVYDIKTGEQKVEKLYSTRFKVNKGNINSWVYDLMIQMKQTPKTDKI